MPTYKEISKIKSELIDRRENKIKGSLEKQQRDLYESLLDDFVKIAKKKVDGDAVDIYLLQNELKKQYQIYFPDTFSQIINTSSSIGNLNYQYFSTLLDSSGIDKIKDKTTKVINKSLGVLSDGTLKTGGFIDKVLEDKTVIKKFTKEVKIILEGTPDIVLMQHKLKEFVTGTKQSTGLLERYYRTFANDLIANIDRTGTLVYADELDLSSFYYAGGVILSSRSFCKNKNGKIFTRAEAEKWKNSAFITNMYGTNIDDYVPLINMGGYGCLHRADWITDDIAKSMKAKK